MMHTPLETVRLFGAYRALICRAYSPNTPISISARQLTTGPGAQAASPPACAASLCAQPRPLRYVAPGLHRGSLAICRVRVGGNSHAAVRMGARLIKCLRRSRIGRPLRRRSPWKVRALTRPSLQPGARARRGPWLTRGRGATGGNPFSEHSEPDI
jgi:hypothetical protein